MPPARTSRSTWKALHTRARLKSSCSATARGSVYERFPLCTLSAATLLRKCPVCALWAPACVPSGPQGGRVARARRRRPVALAPVTGGGASLPPLRELPPGKRLQLGRAYHGPPAIVLVVPVHPGDPRPAPAGSQGRVVPPGSGEAPPALQPPAPRTPPDPEKRRSGARLGV